MRATLVMRFPSLLGSTPLPEPPLWPPILATRGPGSLSALHAHHAIHLLVCLGGELRVRRRARAPWIRAAGVLTGPDVPHAIDARRTEVLLVFFEPESAAGEELRSVLEDVRLLSGNERDQLVDGARADAIMGANGVEWTRRAVATLGGAAGNARRLVHPRVSKLLRILRTMPGGEDRSLASLARAVGLSPSRLMHAFTTSIGIPIRPYLAWLKLQRATAAIAAGAPLGEAAHAAGFADAAHMSRTFRRMFGIAPSSLRSRLAVAS